MSRFAYTWKGINFPNPFLLASCPSTRTGEMIKQGFAAGWGGAVLKTLSSDYASVVDATPRFWGFKGSEIFGFQNTELISHRSPEIWAKEVSELKKQYPDRIIIASVMEDASKLEKWEKTSKIMENAGADLIELNLSCPNFSEKDGEKGLAVGKKQDATTAICKSVSSAVKIPVWAKLPPFPTADIHDLSEACLESGAQGIAVINTVKGFAGIDIHSMKPRMNINGYGVQGGFSGKMVKPIALKCITDIARKNCKTPGTFSTSSLPYISGMGGIIDGEDVIEFLLLGSSSIQVCTEVMLKGYGIVNNYHRTLASYMDSKGYESLEQMIGKGLHLMKDFSELDFQNRVVAEIDPKRCTKCRKCIIACRDSGYQSIQQPKKNGIVSVIKNKCSGCALCEIVCPVNAIKLVNSKL